MKLADNILHFSAFHTKLIRISFYNFTTNWNVLSVDGLILWLEKNFSAVFYTQILQDRKITRIFFPVLFNRGSFASWEKLMNFLFSFSAHWNNNFFEVEFEFLFSDIKGGFFQKVRFVFQIFKIKIFQKTILSLKSKFFANGHPQLDVGSAKRVIICGFLLVKSCRFFTD